MLGAPPFLTALRRFASLLRSGRGKPAGETTWEAHRGSTIPPNYAFYYSHTENFGFCFVLLTIVINIQLYDRDFKALFKFEVVRGFNFEAGFSVSPPERELVATVLVTYRRFSLVRFTCST